MLEAKREVNGSTDQNKQIEPIVSLEVSGRGNVRRQIKQAQFSELDFGFTIILKGGRLWGYLYQRLESLT